MLRELGTARHALGGLVLSLMLTLSSAWAGPMDLGGQFAVSESGAATYTIPIQVPPGTGGMEPKLAFSYNSQTGNGLLGMGWSLSGLSAVTRCARTVAQDGVKGGINFDSNDRYCLDGQRLVAITGAYGADGTEYRTERESFSKIISYGSAGSGPAWFKVWTKAGQILEYGNTADSRIEAQGKTSARVWAVNKVADTTDNYLTFTYTEDSANGDYYPSRIDYTGNAGTGLAANQSVRMDYTLKGVSDQTTAYIAGSLVSTRRRLESITTYQGESFQVSKLQMNYQISGLTSRSRLVGVKQCFQNADCLPETAVAWPAGDAKHLVAVQCTDVAGSGWNSTDYPRYFADVNGDGRADLIVIPNGEAVAYVFLAIGNGLFSQTPVSTDIAGSGWNSTAYPRRFMDVNGDGRMDLVLVAENELIAAVFLANEDGSFATTPMTTDVAGSGWNSTAYPRYFADVNGDGRADLIVIPNGEAVAYVFLATGNGLFSQTPVSTDIAGSGWNSTAYPRRFMDVNGDGRMDLVLVAENELIAAVFLANEDGSFATTPMTTDVAGSGWNSTDYPRYFADVNGDGRADLIVIPNGEAVAYVFLATGNGLFSQTPVSTDIEGSGWNSTAYPRRFVDVNGDGRMDLVLAAESEAVISVFLSHGDGSFSINALVTDIDGSGWASQAYPREFYDVDGDGRSDLVLVAKSEGIACVSRSTPTSDLVESIASGLGKALSVAYTPITNSALYSRDSTAAYPQVDVQVPLYVVSTAISSNGLGGTLTTTYKYGGLKVDLSGRGLLGFRWVEATQAETGLVTRADYRQDWPYVGLPSQSKKTLAGAGNAGTLSLATYSYGCLNPQLESACTVAPGNRYFPYVSTSVESSWDLNGATLPTVTTNNQFDSVGNATVVTVSTSDGYSKTTTNTYTNDATNWHLGRLQRSQVQSVTP